MLRAIIFDFNGIILNDEPVHYRAMRDAVTEIGIAITEEEYWSNYLPLDDERCLAAICQVHDETLSPEAAAATLSRKSALYQTYMSNQFPLFPGTGDFIRLAASRYPLALASGARRDEIEKTLHATGLHPFFRVIVAAQDFKLGKPHPESFLLALERLNRSLNGTTRILPGECLVIEDAVGGVQGARNAGMRCLAISNSYSREQLTAASANLVLASLEALTLEQLQSLFEETS
jgi:beta-phosphoglucomutase-like phosphatase (HAD superfamily)